MVPGVIQIEALAQLSGKLIEVTVFDNDRRWVWPILSIVRKAKFRRFVRPGDTLHVETKVLSVRQFDSKPDRGAVTMEHRTVNQEGADVFSCECVHILQVREAAVPV